MEIPRRKLLEILSRIKLFADISTGDKERLLAPRHIIRVFHEGDSIIRVGEQDDNFYILLAGKAGIYQSEQRVAEVAPGDFVGEVGFICGEPRTATVIADMDVIAMCLDNKAFAGIPVNLREKIKDRLIGALVKRVDSLNRQLAQYKAQ
jgi:CRP-like cAMP-binding protein